MDLSSDAQMPPMIVDGRLSDEWLRRLVRVRAEALAAERLLVYLAKDPYGASLCALPQWWGDWEATLHLPIYPRATPEDAAGGQNPRPEGQE